MPGPPRSSVTPPRSAPTSATALPPRRPRPGRWAPRPGGLPGAAAGRPTLPARAGHRGREEARNEIRGTHGKPSVVLSVLLVAAAILAPACAGGGRTIRLADGQRASAHGEAD